MSEATPFVGISPLVLGMSGEKVRALVGDPDTIESIELSAGEPTESWSYLNTQIKLSFCSTNGWRLSRITTESPNTTIEGMVLVGAEVYALVEALARAGISDIKLTDDCDEFGQCLESEASGLMLWSIEGRIVNATLFPKYDDTGNIPLWPG